MQDMLTELLDNCLSYQLDDLHTMLPAVIITIDYTTRKVSVQPTIKKRKRDGDNDAKGLQDMAIIQNVPLVTPASKLAMLSIPVKVGDEVLLGFFERSVDNYKYSDGSTPIDPQDYRKHDYNDAVAIIGLNTFKSALGMHPEDTVLMMNVGTGQECKLSLKPSGDVQIDTPVKVIVNAGGDVDVNASGNMTATIGGDTTIDCGQTTITGHLRVDGEISSGGDVHTDAGISLENSKMIGNLGKMTSKMLPA
jgi:cytoskeletal protein CcmA (bactofilin family)